MTRFATIADRDRIEAEMPWAERRLPVTLAGLLDRVAEQHGPRPAVSFQMFSDPGAPAETLNWAELRARAIQMANLLNSLGVGRDDVVAYLLPNCTDTVITFLGGAMAGIVAPINPLLEPAQIAALLREQGARVLVTLAPFPKTDIAQKAAQALAEAPGVTHLIEVDLLRHLTGAKRLIVPLIRPRVTARHNARVLRLAAALDRQDSHRLAFEDPQTDRVAAHFHTGGTTGLPKVARHFQSGMIYNGWLGERLLFNEQDTVLCPLPLFHVFACHPILMSALSSGAHVVFPTPAGYRGPGVFDNIWKLIERWRITFLIGVPTAYAAMMQRPLDADISSLKGAFSGSSPLPLEIFRRFHAVSGVEIIEGYGLTEATCLVSCNPIDGTKKVGSVGVALPHTDVRILIHTADGGVRDCATDEIGEICIANPGVTPGGTYTEEDRNHHLFHYDIYLRTGDLGRIDADGFLWITGRAKDLIIRSGHNIDPALIEEALMEHPAVAFAGAIGQPDPRTGEMPCAYVELVAGASTTPEALRSHLEARLSERAALPRHVEILSELPKTAVGKVFKPDLRRRAITRVLDAALAEAGHDARLRAVVEDRKRGLVAQIVAGPGTDRAAAGQMLNLYPIAWDWVDAA